MRVVRWAAAAALTLMSLMNLGAVGDSSVGLAITGIVLGVLGLAAVYGLLRTQPWGRPAGAAVSAGNLIASVVGLAVGWDGAVIMIVVSLVGLALSYLTGPLPARISALH